MGNKHLPGSVLRDARIAAGLTQTDVAREMGWHSAARACAYEREHVPLTPAMAERVLAAIARAAFAKARPWEGYP
jgi:transcriptional regulator with XRE-family HTH domain